MLKVKYIQGDITKVAVDIIVNAANTLLLGGGGVDGAIKWEKIEPILQDCLIKSEIKTIVYDFK